MLWLLAVVGIVALAHTAPFPFLLDITDRTVWRMAQIQPPMVYLTFDDGPNPAATPQVLDVLRKHGVKATFFVIDRHLTAETAPIVRRTFEEGHSVGLHSDTRALMFYSPARVSTTLQEAAARMEVMTGHPPCRAFRPHAGHRSVTMIDGAGGAGYRVIGFGWMLWDFNFFRKKTAASLAPRLARNASPGDIIVIHDGHHKDSGADRRYAVETTDALIPMLKAKGFGFGTICPN